MRFVVKLGGAALEDKKLLHACGKAIADLVADGNQVAVVHGGGVQLTRMMERLGANRARSRRPATAPARSHPRSGGFKNQAWSANAMAGANCSRCTPSFIVFDRASSTAMMRAPLTRARNPDKVVAMAVG